MRHFNTLEIRYMLNAAFNLPLSHRGLQIIPTGSREIYSVGSEHYVNNVTTESDEDYVVLLPENADFWSMRPMLEAGGWIAGGSTPSWGNFMSFKQTIDGITVNIIMVNDKKVFTAWRLSTLIAKQFQPKNKEERIRLFKSVFDSLNSPFVEES